MGWSAGTLVSLGRLSLRDDSCASSGMSNVMLTYMDSSGAEAVDEAGGEAAGEAGSEVAAGVAGGEVAVGGEAAAGVGWDGHSFLKVWDMKGEGIVSRMASSLETSVSLGCSSSGRCWAHVLLKCGANIDTSLFGEGTFCCEHLLHSQSISPPSFTHCQ